MKNQSTQKLSKTPPDVALELLNEAWSYYTPRPRLVTETNSKPAPVIAEYYAA